MKRQHRRWHRMVWSLLLPTLAGALLLGVWLRPRTVVNPDLPKALENAPVEGSSPEAALTRKTR